MMKYKLLKDLPGVKSGTIYEIQDNGWALGNNPADTPFDMVHVSALEDYSDWFEPVEETPKRWRAEPFKKSSYYIVMPELYASKTTDKDRGVDKRRHKIGNYFQTQEQAQAVADAFKAVLEYVHDTEANLTTDDVVRTAARAWEALQKGNEDE